MSVRPYQDYRRSELQNRLSELTAERAQLDQAIQRLETERKAVPPERKPRGLFGRLSAQDEEFNLKVMAEQIRLTSTITEFTRRITRGTQERTDINLELKIRDSPDLMRQYGGAGAD